MLGARKLVLQFGHLLLRAVQDTAEFIREAQIDSRAVDFRTALQLRAQSFAQLLYICSNFLKEGPGYSVALLQKSGKKMLVGDFLIISLESQILRGLKRFLHLLRELVDAHL